MLRHVPLRSTGNGKFMNYIALPRHAEPFDFAVPEPVSKGRACSVKNLTAVQRDIQRGSELHSP